MNKDLTPSRSLDKFYTSPKLAAEFVSLVYSLFPNISTVLEPSAGDGAFLSAISEVGCCGWESISAIDIAPERDGISRGDFFEYKEHADLIIGNPPFGKNSSLAVKFFNHAASLNPKAIAFILPRTFQKRRYWSKLDTGYSLLLERICPKNSFLLNGAPYNVPCVAQVWECLQRRSTLPNHLSLFSVCDPLNTNALFIRRAGGRAGQIVNREDYCPASTYSVLCSDTTKELLICYKDKITEQSCKTVGVRSITLLEIEDILLGRYEV